MPLLSQQSIKHEGNHVLALLLSALGILIALHPAVAHFSTHYLGETTGDGGLYVWLSRHAYEALFHNYTTTYLYPHGLTLAWSDMFLAPAALSEALQWLGLSHIQAYNTTLFAGAIGNCFFTYLLVRELRLSFLAALIAGFTFALSDTFLSHAGHPQFYWSFFLPWSLTIASRITTNVGKWQLFLEGLLLGAVLSLALVTSAYVFIFAVTALAFWAFGRVVGLRKQFLMLLPAAIGAALPCLAILPIIRAYISVKETFGARGIYETFYLSATPLGYFAVIPGLAWRSFSANLGNAENSNFFGIILIAILVFALVRAKNKAAYFAVGLLGLLALLDTHSSELLIVENFGRGTLYAIRCLLVWILFIGSLNTFRKKRWLSLTSAVCLGLICICFSFGPLGLGTGALPALSPFALFRNIIPGLDGLRASARFAVAACLCFSVAGAHAVAVLNNFIKVGLIILIVAVQTVTSLPLESPEPPPSVLEPFIQNVLEPGAVLILPLLGEKTGWGSYAVTATRYMNWLASYRYPLVNGYSGVTSKLQKEFYEAASENNLAKQAQSADEIAGVRYLVTLGSLRITNASFQEKACDTSGCLYERLATDPSETLILPPLQEVIVKAQHGRADEIIGTSVYPIGKTLAGFTLETARNSCSPRRIHFSTELLTKPIRILPSATDAKKSPWLCALPMFYCTQ